MSFHYLKIGDQMSYLMLQSNEPHCRADHERIFMTVELVTVMAEVLLCCWSFVAIFFSYLERFLCSHAQGRAGTYFSPTDWGLNLCSGR